MTLLAPPDIDLSDDFDAASVIDASFAAGDDAALRAAYDQYGSLVYSICRRSVDEASAADITQEVFLAAWRHRDRYHPDRGSLAPWLTGIARNKVIDHFRAVGREDRRVDKVRDNSTLEPVDELNASTSRMLLVDAMEALPERARRIVSLAFFDDMTHVEISAQTGIPLGTVKSDIRRSLDKLRHGLGYDHG
ncbi:MAG: sigma-70 family RNA polymerase sigma factor [Acidimicrobiales bacterium]|nr:sigma-70 family RNA polymerase sigma factor [Acidimicrobiales bacterium]